MRPAFPVALYAAPLAFWLMLAVSVGGARLPRRATLRRNS